MKNFIYLINNDISRTKKLNEQNNNLSSVKLFHRLMLDKLDLIPAFFSLTKTKNKIVKKIMKRIIQGINLYRCNFSKLH